MSGASMANPITLTVLGTAAATEGIKFLYAQATELLKGWRQRRDARDAAEPVSVPVIASPALDGPPKSHRVDAEVVRREYDVLLHLASAIAPVANDLVDLDLEDSVLAQRAGELRELLEEIYHQRLTFRGESREQTGTAVTVRQRVQNVQGLLVGADAEVTGDARVNVDQELGTVEDGGSATAFKGKIGR